MITIVTALRIEASPFIKYYNLKRDTGYHHNELYINSDSTVSLLITRPGKLPAAIALTELFATHKPTGNDYMINIGICGSCEDYSDNTCTPVFLCNRLLDHDTNRYYYPDVLFKHDFREAGIETFSVAVDENNNPKPKEMLVDMEASALFVAGSTFLSPHQMYFLKIPSDKLNPDKVTPATVTDTLSGCAPSILTWIDDIRDNANNSLGASVTAFGDSTGLTADELSLFDTIRESLRLSVTMTEQLRQLFTYKKLRDGDLSGIEFCPPEGNVTNQKRKILFEELKEQFLQ